MLWYWQPLCLHANYLLDDPPVKQARGGTLESRPDHAGYCPCADVLDGQLQGTGSSVAHAL